MEKKVIQFPVVIDLPSGSKAEIKEFKGRDVIHAQRMMGQDPEKYMTALMAVIVTIDGEAKTMEDFLDMDGRDMLVLQTEFSGVVFT
jgi:hypothetical protein